MHWPFAAAAAAAALTDNECFAEGGEGGHVPTAERGRRPALARCRHGAGDAAPAPRTIAPNQTFEHAGHTYRLRSIDRIGAPYAEVEVEAEQQITGQHTGLPVRTWPSLLAFMAETGLKPIADRSCAAADLQFLRDKLAAGEMILVATDIGLPTIHTADNGYPEASSASKRRRSSSTSTPAAPCGAPKTASPGRRCA